MDPNSDTPQDSTNKPQENQQTPTNSGQQPQQASANPAGINPEDIKGKTPEEIVKFVSEQSEKYGGLQKELENYKKYYQEMNPIVEFINKDKELLDAIETKWNKVTGKVPEPAKVGESQSTEADLKLADTRRGLENQIIQGFIKEKGIDKLPQDKGKEIVTAIGQQLMDIYDPGGKKSYSDVLSSISLEKLPVAFEKAYKLATYDDSINNAKRQAELESQSGATGVMGSMPSAGGSGEEISLTPKQREAARKMGISEEKYLKSVKEIIARNSGQ